MTDQTLSVCWPKGTPSGKINPGDLAFPHRITFSVHCPLGTQSCNTHILPLFFFLYMIFTSQALLLRKFSMLSKLPRYIVTISIYTNISMTILGETKDSGSLFVSRRGQQQIPRAQYKNGAIKWCFLWIFS